MDNLRGHFPEHDESTGDRDDLDAFESRELPPAAIGQDERRMQVRAYNFWASLLDNRNFPSIEDLEPECLPDFGPYSVLLDFTQGIENPAIPFLGDKLAEECGTDGNIACLDDVPSRSLLSRITDHYMQILANQAPIGFEAEFVNQRGSTILYRGILLPFSSDDDTIDFIYGVINWKELADQQTADELLLEIDQALEVKPLVAESPLTEWADGPVDDSQVLAFKASEDQPAETVDWPEPGFGAEPFEPGNDDLAGGEPLDLADLDDGYDLDEPLELTDLAPAFAEEPAAASRDDNALDLAGMDGAFELAEPEPSEMGLGDWLASARELAAAARGSEDRSRQALYDAIGRAHDFALAATLAPEEFAELVVDSGLVMQDRAPLTPLVKLVFGSDYDKTRLAEFASAIAHAQRLGLARGSFAEYLGKVEGGLKGVVASERRLRKQEAGVAAAPRETPREAIARKLRKIAPLGFEDIPAEGAEFTLLVARRLPTGEVVVLGEVADDVALIERAARKLVA